MGKLWLAGLVAAGVAGCSQPWNDPYPDIGSGESVLFESFFEKPRHLDPALSYAANEVEFTAQIYEPALQYHYFRRPYELVPLAADAVPEPEYLDAERRPLPANAPAADIAFSRYTIDIQPGIRYQPHPAFARDAGGKPLYMNLSAQDVSSLESPQQFAQLGSRELKAADYVHQIKRLANPRAHSPILGLMNEHIVGLAAFTERVKQADAALQAERGRDAYVDLTQYDIEGVEVLGDHRFSILVEGQYPQLRFWLAMPFFAPVPPEASRFYQQKALRDRNMTLDTFPVGTGPYMLTVNDPNRRMVLEKNPNFRGEPFPAPADPEAASDYPVGQTMPFIDRVVFSLEKEQIPYWNKFLQGYYDASGISSDSFGEAIRVDRNGEPHLTQTMARRGVTLKTTVSPAIYYLGFNMQDDVVGGDDERARLLRRAISIALDYESYIAIFRNGRGIAAQGPIPPGIFGTQDGEQGINPYVYDWDNGRARRKSVEHARELLARAGYPGGVNEQTGEPLLLNLDTPATGPEFKAQLDWMRKQFSKLNIQLVVRATAYNRFQEKLASGAVQLFQSGWLADYPDPENFLFLLYGPNGSVDHNGENVANYDNERFDQLFRQMRIMDNGPQRRALIRQMVDIVQRDAPWIWGFYPRTYILHQAWLNNGNPNAMANNTLKYLQIEPQQRLAKQSAWNDPVIWPLPALAGILLAGLLPGFLVYRRRERQAPVVKS